ncbi:hypothetical protein Bca52824_002244 [Brassica carinata]|uniref:Uncharacterized protein n=1 Tax=Brassica carinata TaxID=52824 RepID=A0A8X7WHQ9_BRACI|nr:hypothetical protein Bca52824_002244 [Brassica carinata]
MSDMDGALKMHIGYGVRISTDERETNPKRPRRQKKTQSQSSINTPDVISSCPEASTRPSLSIATDAATRQTATSRGRGRGRPPGQGQARREVIPRGHGVYISPFTNRSI